MDYGEFISRNIAAWRAMRRLKQSSLAARMRALGFPWHQQTVGAVERDERRVSAEEVLGLALALQTVMAELLKPAELFGAPEPMKAVVLPSGDSLTVNDVMGLVYSANDGAVTWDGDKPIFSPGGARPTQESGR